MSDTSDNDVPQECAEEEDLQMAFVTLLADYGILFDKRQTPVIKQQKDKAAAEMAVAYGKNTNKTFTPKQIMKKFNNMKMKVKAASDARRTGNKKIVLSAWQKKFYDLWNKGNNPVLNKVVGAVEARYQCLESTISGPSHLPPPPVKKKKHSEEPEEFRTATLQELQRACLIQQIKTARAQEQGANAVTAYYSNKTSSPQVESQAETFSGISSPSALSFYNL